MFTSGMTTQPRSGDGNVPTKLTISDTLKPPPRPKDNERAKEKEG